MRFAIAFALCVVLAGCTTYYQVHDPSTDSTYYTTKIDQEDGGGVSLKDARTNAQVTVQTSEVMEITAEQYDAAIRTTEPPRPAAPKMTPNTAPTPAPDSKEPMDSTKPMDDESTD